jgi:hypothetical protein
MILFVLIFLNLTLKFNVKMSYNSDKLNSNEDFSWPPCDLKDTKNIDDKFICPKCKTLMVNVHQADDCGCRYCLDCLDQM